MHFATIDWNSPFSPKSPSWLQECIPAWTIAVWWYMERQKILGSYDTPKPRTPNPGMRKSHGKCEFCWIGFLFFVRWTCNFRWYTNSGDTQKCYTPKKLRKIRKWWFGASLVSSLKQIWKCESIMTFGANNSFDWWNSHRFTGLGRGPHSLHPVSFKWIPSLKLTWHLKMDGWNTGILVSFWDGLFSGAMLVLGRVIFQLSIYRDSLLKM